MNAPLAERMRPQDLDAFLGQEKLVGPQGSLRTLLQQQLIPSMIFWGPPGVGKTTLAEIIAKQSGRAFFNLSAINSGVKEVRAIIQKAEGQGLFGQGKTPILFIDEIHRFSKSQQDSLLGAVERGVIVLIGATTENPSFEVISALLSRCQVYVLESHRLSDLEQLIQRALKEDPWLQKQNLEVAETKALLRYSGGDARKTLNNLELLAQQVGQGGRIDNKKTQEVLQRSGTRYDKGGEQHYDIISAFIKSIRGSDPNAAVYWLARMIEGGEDPKFIARRLIISAAEDIGLANPNALLLANQCFEALQKIGWPEGRIILSQCAIYLATSPKSNSAYLAIGTAQKAVKEKGDLPVPLPLRNAPSQLMKELDYGRDYRYPFDYSGNFVNQEYLPEEISGTAFYAPLDNSNEKKASDSLRERWPKYFKK